MMSAVVRAVCAIAAAVSIVACGSARAAVRTDPGTLVALARADGA
jgi:hypothetical protein